MIKFVVHQNLQMLYFFEVVVPLSNLSNDKKKIVIITLYQWGTIFGRNKTDNEAELSSTFTDEYYFDLTWKNNLLRWHNLGLEIIHLIGFAEIEEQDGIQQIFQLCTVSHLIVWLNKNDAHLHNFPTDSKKKKVSKPFCQKKGKKLRYWTKFEKIGTKYSS